MAITTWETVDICVDEYNDLKIGLSQTIDALSYDEIASNCYCASSWNDLTNPYTIEKHGEEYDGKTWSTTGDTDIPVTLLSYYVGSTADWATMGEGGMEVATDGIASNICFVYGTNNDFDGGGNLHADSGAKIITKLDPSLFRIKTGEGSYSVEGNDYDLDNGIMRRVQVQYKKWLDANHTTFSWVDCGGIYPCMVFNSNGNNYITALYSSFSTYDIFAARYSDDGIVWKNYGFSAFNSDGETFDFTYATNLHICFSAEGRTEYVNSHNQFSVYNSNHYSNTTYTTDVDGIGAYYAFSYKNGGITYGWYGDAALDYMSRYGMYFYDTRTQKEYKPIISGGWVTGYTDDLSTPSEIDDYTYEGGTSHDIQPTPPAPPVTDEFEELGLSMVGEGSSFVSWYGMTKGEMNKLVAFMNGTNELADPIPAGMDIFSHIIGCFQAPFSISGHCAGTSVAEIKMAGLNTGASGFALGNQSASSTITLGSTRITPTHHNFLDYEPYTKITLYIPYCGCVDLPPSIFMNNELTVKFVYDIFSGECCGIVFAGGTFYTSISGSFTSLHAVSSNNCGAIKEAMVNGTMSIIGGAVATVGGVAAGNIGVAGAGLMSMFGGTAKSLMDMNGVSPQMRGTCGGRASFYKPSKCELYITTPKDNISNEYIQTNGLPVNKVRTLASGDGFTIVDTPVINGNMTLREKNEIESIMKTGIIL